MKAVRIYGFGGPEVLKLEEISQPEPGEGEVLVRVHAASINPVDYKTRSGSYPPVKKRQLPLVLGRDVAGVIEGCGPGVRDWKPGQAVYAMLPQDRGGYAEWVALPAEGCVAMPEELDPLAAAAVPLAGLTAWQGLFDHGRLRSGQHVLIHGAAGGVGHFAVQFARAKGASVWATCSGEDALFVRDLGAARAIDYKKERFEEIASDVDLVFDLVGGDTQERSWKVLKRGGTLVSTLAAPSKERASEREAQGAVYTAQPSARQLTEISRLVAAGQVRPTVAKVSPLAEAAAAQRQLEEEGVHGKSVLRVL